LFFVFCFLFFVFFVFVAIFRCCDPYTVSQGLSCAKQGMRECVWQNVGNTPAPGLGDCFSHCAGRYTQLGFLLSMTVQA
jgi:hypothetical protein